MRCSLPVLGLLLLTAGGCHGSFDPALCPDADNLNARDRKEFEWAVAEGSYIFSGTLLQVDTSWRGYSGLAVSCADMTFSVERVIAGKPPSGRVTLGHTMVGPGLWVEEREGQRGLRLSPRVFRAGVEYIVIGDSRYRNCGKDGIDSIWLNTPSNLAAVVAAIPIPVAEASDPPIVERREPTGPWNWDYDARKVTGAVGLSVVVTQSGYPARVEITDPLFPELDKDVADWIRSKWRFRPAKKAGRPVPVRMALSVQVASGVPEGMK